jgi:hypothetical protein
MRQWIWRTLARAGSGFSAGGLWTFGPPDPECIAWSPERSDTAAQCTRADQRGRPRGRGKRDLVQECEAFVTGSYYEVLLQQHQPIPPWAWVNALAHGARCEVERIAGLPPARPDSMAFLSYMACEVLLHASADDATLRHVQESTLIPLEMDLLREPAPCDQRSLAKRVRDDLCTSARRPCQRPGGY